MFGWIDDLIVGQTIAKTMFKVVENVNVETKESSKLGMSSLFAQNILLLSVWKPFVPHITFYRIGREKTRGESNNNNNKKSIKPNATIIWIGEDNRENKSKQNDKRRWTSSRANSQTNNNPIFAHLNFTSGFLRVSRHLGLSIKVRVCFQCNRNPGVTARLCGWGGRRRLHGFWYTFAFGGTLLCLPSYLSLFYLLLYFAICHQFDMHRFYPV